MLENHDQKTRRDDETMSFPVTAPQGIGTCAPCHAHALHLHMYPHAGFQYVPYLIALRSPASTRIQSAKTDSLPFQANTETQYRRDQAACNLLPATHFPFLSKPRLITVQVWPTEQSEWIDPFPALSLHQQSLDGPVIHIFKLTSPGDYI
jgi:hypothetical protein